MKTYLDWKQIEDYTANIAKQISREQWKPDYVVGLTRGGLIPATLLSHWFDCPMWTLTVKLRDHAETESNCWMAEDAFGYIPQGPLREGIDKASDATFKKQILIVDDINDTGATLNWIKEDWQSSCLPASEEWNHVWDNNVRVATLINKYDSKTQVPVRYSGHNTTMDDNNAWVVFPWERWSDE